MTTTEHKGVCYYLKQICTCKPKNLLCWGVFLLVFYFFTGKTTTKYNGVTFDYIIFTQRWLPTACIQYLERPSPYSRRCTLPSNFKLWAIHGLWPTDNNHMGPFFCNESLVFDMNAIKPIEADLMNYWPNIEGDKDYISLWRHEWIKHGTCAAQLDSLNTELKYFSTTLGLYKKYNINNIFKSYNVEPSLRKGYFLSDLFNIMQSGLGKMPQIHCAYEAYTHQPYLFEIRICFDKNLTITDCKDVQGRIGRTSTLTNCPRDRAIIYPDTSTPPDLSKEYLENIDKDFRGQLFDLHQVIKFVQWIVL